MYVQAAVGAICCDYYRELPFQRKVSGNDNQINGVVRATMCRRARAAPGALVELHTGPRSFTEKGTVPHLVDNLLLFQPPTAPLQLLIQITACDQTYLSMSDLLTSQNNCGSQAEGHQQ